MEDCNRDVHTRSRRSRKTVFKGPIRGFIYRARGRGEVVAYNECTYLNDERESSPTRIGHESGTPLHDSEHLIMSGDKFQQTRGITNEAKALEEEPVDIPLLETSQNENLAENGEIVGPAQSTKFQTKIQEIHERTPEFKNPSFNFRQLEKEFHKLSPDMQKYLILLQKKTQSDYLFNRVAPPADPDADMCQR